MQIMIKISEDIYEDVKKTIISDEIFDEIVEAFRNGIPLPKGHGRLIDESYLMPDSDYEDGLFYAVSIEHINSAPTIIEADKEE